MPKINGAEVRAQADVRWDDAEDPVAAKAEGLEVVEPGNAVGDGPENWLCDRSSVRRRSSGQSAPAKSGEPESWLPDTLRWSRSGLLAASPSGTGTENWLPDRTKNRSVGGKAGGSGPEKALPMRSR